jgi:hypothetical protein
METPMTTKTAIAAANPAPEFARLRHKIGWICHCLRLATVAFATWVLYVVLALWLDTNKLHQALGHLIGANVSALAPWQRWSGLSIDLGLWATASIACYCGWRLFSTYLEGRIFSVEAARWMQRVAFWGIITQVASIALRPLFTLVMTAHLPPAERQAHLVLQPNDLLTLLLLLSLLALAHIQRTGAEIAAEHAQII